MTGLHDNPEYAEPADEADQLKQRLRQILVKQAKAEALVTYKDLVERLGIQPPQSIHQLTILLEDLMAQDAKKGEPLLAALCVGRLRHNLPAPGFFITASQLELFTGNPQGEDARNFHERELAKVLAAYR